MTEQEKLVIQLAAKVEQKMFHAGNLLKKGKVSPPKYLAYVVRNAKEIVNSMPRLNPKYQPQHADETPESLQQLDAIGDGEVTDEMLNEAAEGEADESIDFDGGGQFNAEL